MRNNSVSDEAAGLRRRSAGRGILTRANLIFLALFLLIQISIMVAAALGVSRYYANYVSVGEFISLCVVLYIIREDAHSSYKIPWIVLSLLIPIFGGVLYLIFGRVRLSPSERRKSKRIHFDYQRAGFSENDAYYKLRAEAPDIAMQAAYIRKNAEAPVYDNTYVEYFPSGEAMQPRLLEELRKAEKCIFMEYFIIQPGNMWNEIEDILSEKAKQGVDVRVMYDHVGCMGRVPVNFAHYLMSRGIRCQVFNRLTNVFSSKFNYRDHRKICIIDGNVGFTGGINIADEYINEHKRFGYWKDTAIMQKGKGVQGLTNIFIMLWDFMSGERTAHDKFAPDKPVEAPGYVQPFSDSPMDHELVGETVYGNLLRRADKYVYITTPYLIIDESMINDLSIAAKSGVDVRIVTPGIPDKRITYTLTRSYYDVLLRAGVRIYEYTPGFMHAKMYVSDDECAVLGTINMDYRSLCHHYECAVWMYKTDAVKDIRDDMRKIFRESREVTLDTLGSRLLIGRVFLAVLRVFAPLF